MKNISEMKTEILQTKTVHELLNVKASFIGKGGIITEEFKKMKDHSNIGWIRKEICMLLETEDRSAYSNIIMT